MWQDLTHLSVSPLDLVVRAVAVYLFVLVLLRLAGKRQLAQMGATEFVAILLISNAVQNSMNGGDNSLAGGLLLAVVLILTSSAISWATYRSARARALFEGSPRILIHKGKPIPKNLAKERIPLNELRTLLRKQGVHQYNEVATAILESDGSLTVFKAGEPDAPKNLSP